LNILEILRERQRRQTTETRQNDLVPGIIIRIEGTRYFVNDGTHSVACETAIGEPLREGDRVWLGRGRGVSVILGFQGRDKSF
jgi:hypothetical protein